MIDKRRIKVRLFSVSQLDSPTRLLGLALACLLLRGARTHPAASPAPKHTRPCPVHPKDDDSVPRLPRPHGPVMLCVISAALGAASARGAAGKGLGGQGGGGTVRTPAQPCSAWKNGRITGSLYPALDRRARLRMNCGDTLPACARSRAVFARHESSWEVAPG